MTVSVSSLFAPQTPTEWLATILQDGVNLGLSSTSWQDGQPVLTILQILGLELSKEDALGISLRAQGGFLDFAASGSVTVTDYDGTTTTVPVTPDPSIPSQNPNGTPGLLDTLASSVYNVERIASTAASFTESLVNLSGSSLGTFAVGTFHIQNWNTLATYSNTESFTFSPTSIAGTSVSSATATSPVVVTTSAAHGLTTGEVVYALSLGVVSNAFYSVTVINTTQFSLNASTGAGSFNPSASPAPAVYVAQQIPFAADISGSGGNAAPGYVNVLVTTAPKSFCSNLTAAAGADWQSNASLAATCRAKLATLSANGPPGAYNFFAVSAYTILSGQPLANGLTLTSPLPAAITLDGGPVQRTKISLNPTNGQVTITVANTDGPVAGCMNVAVTGATTASPIVITTGAPHGCVTGDYVQVNGIQGLSGASGQFVATVIDTTHLSLDGSSGSGTYTASTGQLSGGDLYAISAIMAAYSTPQAVTVNVVSAVAVPFVISATVYVPAAFVADYLTKMTALLTTYFSSFPVGGVNVDNLSNVLPIGLVEGLLFSAGQSNGQTYTTTVSNVTLNGSPTDLALTAQGVAQLGTLTGITIVGQ